MRRCFIDTCPRVGETAEIKGAEAWHIVRVLRLKPADPLVLFTGRGEECHARICSVAPDRVVAEVLAVRPSASGATQALTVAMGFLKEKKMDDLVRPLTELGMTRFLPFFAARSVARPSPERMAARRARWEKIARESLKQCRRAVMPEILPAASFGEMLRLSAGSDMKIVFWEEADQFLSPPGALAQAPSKMFVVIGPEGGLSREEVAAARADGFIVSALGPRILRAETAALAACTIMQYAYGDMAAPPTS